MYSTCLFCNRALGTNDSIEELPIGRRLAFDSEKGRLWVVCPSCRRWNLTPIEERWEAVESCERLFRAQKLRAQTDNIGLAKLPDGTELVRIGRALRPELAAWRYGRVFGERLRRQVMVLGGGGAVVAGTAAVIGGTSTLVASVTTLAPLAIIGYLAMMTTLGGRGRMISTKVMGEDGKVLRVFRADLQHLKLLGEDAEGGDPWRLRLRHSYGTQQLTGERARRALGTLLASVNRTGAARGTVGDATAILTEASDPARVATLVAAESRRRGASFDEQWAAFQRGDWMKGSLKSNQSPVNRGALQFLPAEQRLALEMALHEESERRALEGELALLEAAWREAEEIAQIADGMLTEPVHMGHAPPQITDSTRLKLPEDPQ